MLNARLHRLFRSYATSQNEMTCRDALNKAMEEEMLRDDKVFILGEEVAKYNVSISYVYCDGTFSTDTFRVHTSLSIRLIWGLIQD